MMRVEGHSAMRRARAATAVTVVVVALSGLFLPCSTVSACPVCFGGMTPQKSLVDWIDEASDVVVAEAGSAEAPGSGGETDSSLKVRLVLKGAADLEGRVITGDQLATAGADAAARRSIGGSPPGRRMLLTRPDARTAWTTRAIVALHHQAFLSNVLDLPSGKDMSEDDRLERLAFFRAYLAHRDPLIAEAALLEWARAPYRVLRAAAGEIEAATVRAWLADQNFRGGRALAIVLLGVRGEESDGGTIKAMLDDAWESGDATVLGALLTARIEQSGEEGIRFVEERYIVDRDRTLDEVRAAVAALCVHGEVAPLAGAGSEGDGSVVDRARFVSALHRMFEHRRPLAGLAAPSLAAWKDWSVADDYAELLLSGEPCLPSTRSGIIGYLEDCPLPVAREAISRLPGRRN